MVSWQSSPVSESVPVRVTVLAKTTVLPRSPLRTSAFNTIACRNVIQIGALYPFVTASFQSTSTLIP